MSIDYSARFSRRNFLNITGAAFAVPADPASFSIGETARAQTPTTLNMLACYTGLEAGK